MTPEPGQRFTEEGIPIQDEEEDTLTVGWSEDPDAGELLERAWGIIANADWDNAATGDTWRNAAISFREAYFQWIKNHATVPDPEST